MTQKAQISVIGASEGAPEILRDAEAVGRGIAEAGGGGGRGGGARGGGGGGGRGHRGGGGGAGLGRAHGVEGSGIGGRRGGGRQGARDPADPLPRRRQPVRHPRGRHRDRPRPQPRRGRFRRGGDSGRRR